MAFLALIPSFLAHKDVLFMQTLRLPVTAKCRNERQDLLDWRQSGSRRHFKSPSDAVISARFIMKSQQPETWIWQAPLILVGLFQRHRQNLLSKAEIGSTLRGFGGRGVFPLQWCRIPRWTN